jgi:amino acid adenylation domain-containing protein/non-ribosomal peptide synthase protein (TIGR01720 family)
VNAPQLLAELERRGIRLWAEAGKLRYDAPKGALDDALRGEVKALRDDLLTLLDGSGSGTGSGTGSGSGSGSDDDEGPVPVPREGELPLSFGQQRLWFLSQLVPEDRAYNVPATVRLQGELDVPALGRALDEIVRRHEVLRSHMPVVDGKATLVIEPHAPCPLVVESVEGDSPEARLEQATRLAKADAVQPFDLEQGPLFHVRLFRLEPDEHVLHVLMHHVISDGWSMGVFFKELAALYGAFLAGRPSPLPDLAIQYLDHAAWQQGETAGRQLAKGVAWWKERLAGTLPQLALPTDHARPPSPSHHGASQWFPIDPGLRDDLLHLSRREGVTRFQLLLSAFYVLLARHTGQDDLVVGTPVAGRSRREIEGLIGFFVNNLVLRGDLSGNPTFQQLLRRVRGLAIDAFAHQDTPFEQVVEAVSPDRELGRNPLFQVLFNHFDLSDFSYELPPLELSTIDMTLDVSKFDLTLHCFEKDDILVAKLEYDTTLFDHETVRRMGERFEVLLRGIVAHPEHRIARLPVLTDEERRQQLITWNREEGAPPAATSVHGLFEAQAAATPQRTALVCGRERLSYAELDARATALALRLRELGVGPEVRVALFLERSADMVVALLGVLKAGGAFVPMEPGAPTARVAHQLRDADCQVVITHGDLATRLPGSAPDLQAEADAPMAPGVQGQGDAPAAPAVLAMQDVPSAPGDASALPPARPGQLAYVIYTSGSTGEPKGVAVEHAQLLHYVTNVDARLDVPADSHYATVSTLAADLGHTCIFPALCHGGTLHVMGDERIRDGDAFAEAMAQQGVDVLKIVPTHLAALLAAAQRPADVLPRRLLVLGGEACTWELVDRVRELAPECEILNHYGPAETTVGVTTHRITDDDRARHPDAPPLGRPLPGTRVYLVDAELQPVPVGSAGELLVGGGGVTRGYLGQPELTAGRFVPDPFRRGSEGRLYRTGDQARYTREGQLVFLGRVDDQVKVRGHRVEPGEVAAALQRHPELEQAAVVAASDERGQARLAAYVVSGEAQAPSVDELRSFLARSLPDYMLPSTVTELPALPLTPNGKLDRAALPTASADDSVRRAAFVAPRTPAEQTLARIWCDVLRLDQVGVHDDFFELGGESILSIQIVSRANQAGLRLKARDVFEWGTIAELATVAREAQAAAGAAAPEPGPVPLTPIQHRFFAQDPAAPWHYNHAMLLCVRQPVGVDVLSRALAAVEQHHDVLRLRFTRTADEWQQTLVAPAAGPELTTHDLSGSAPEARVARMEALAAEAQASLSLEEGPLWRAVHFRCGADAEDRLLLVIHHLAVDGVSWRLLLEDLTLACEQLERGEAPALPPRTSSFGTWAAALEERASDPAFLQSVGRWPSPPPEPVAPLPVDHAPGPGAQRADRVQTLEFVLDEDETERLLRAVPGAYRTRINDALLTALARAFAPWTGSPRLLVDLEGHGREDAFDELDTSRTVGWFTSVHPVLLDLSGAGKGAEGSADTGVVADAGSGAGAGAGAVDLGAIGEALCAVKEQLRAAPDRGVGWGLARWLSPSCPAVDALRAQPTAQVGFNFMGQFDRSVEQGGLFHRAPESPGPGTDPANTRPYLLDVGGSVSGGRLRVSWTWSTDVHERATIEALAHRFGEALRALIAHCTTPGVGRRTPSDFPLARLDAAGLATLEQRFGADRIEDVYLLSPLQRGMVFHSLADGGGDGEHSAYVTQLALTLCGSLDPERFRQAWQRVVERRSVLRTAFVVHGLSELHQVVCRDVTLRWVTEDVSALDDPAQAERLAALGGQHRREGFDLESPPLMRLGLVRLGPERHRLIWTHHHALLDGWSLPLLVRDVFTAYASADDAAQSGSAQDELEERRPFAESIRWIEEQSPEDAARHWRAEFEGWGGPTPLPVDPALSPAASSSSRGRVGLTLDEPVTDTLQALARGHRLTLNTLVQGAWALLLSRHAASTDVLFGVTVSGRPPDLPGVEAMLGLFINTLPLRVDTSDAALIPWLEELQRKLLELQQRQADALYEVRQMAGVSGRGALFESLVVFENYPLEMSEPLAAAGLTIAEGADVSHASDPLALVVQPGPRLSLELRHDTARFGAPCMERLLRQLATLLEAMGRRPECRLGELPLLRDQDRDAVLARLNPLEPASYPRDRTVGELFAEQARARPDAPALSYGDETLTYAQLAARAETLRAGLASAGVGGGDLVAVSMEPGAEMIASLLAIVQTGAAYLPLDPREPAGRAGRILEDSGTQHLLTDDGATDLAAAFAGRVHGVAELARTASVEGASSADAADAVGSTDDADSAGDASPRPDITATSPAYVIYTSGSTGAPKGTTIPHRGIVSLVRDTDYVSLGPSDRVAQAANPSFDAATFEIWGPLLNGACVVGLGRDVMLSPQALADTLRRERITTLFVTTALFNQLVARVPDVFASLDTLLFGGEAVSPPAVRTVLERGAPGRVLHVYGPTECTTFSTWHHVTSVPEGARTVPIGRPIGHSDACVLDHAGQLAAPGALGELCLGGDGLALGYHGRTDLTAERFVAHPFAREPAARLYRTGDLVRQGDDGALEFVGRVDHQVKLRGFRIELGEVEAALLGEPGVKATAVICREDVPGNKQLVAYVETEGDDGPIAEGLREALAQALPAYMVPDLVQVLPALPVNKNGKIDRAALPAPERRAVAPSAGPSSQTEQRIAGIWRGVLGLESVGVADNFFDLGGHSLRLLAVHARLVDELGATLSITDMFDHATIKDLAGAIDGDQGTSTRETPLRPEAKPAPSGADTAGDQGAVAIVGMAGRFPGSADVGAFWENLCGGVECVSFFGHDELRASGIPGELLAHPSYVPARAVLDEPDRFDARFFGYTPLEAELMDPQQRLFLECCHEALETAALDPDRFDGRVGVFGGASMNSYLDALRTRPEVFARAGGMAALISSIHDFLTTRVSYQLNLRGPSVNVQTACSTSLVAVHEACRSLAEGRSDAALAGGVSVTVPWVSGYVHETSGVRSSDGHCRTFDAQADGMVSGNGVGVVVLKRLADAVASGDMIHAVILGTAINNDGARKLGFTAPSIEGQAEVIASAQAAAGIEPRSLGYVECHGTGTALGDPIEVAALTRVFRERTGDTGFCALASLKSNMGHLDAAAGVAGLMKAALAVRDGVIPPSLHYQRPNPEIDFPSGPFFVNTERRPWAPEDGAPRRSAVSAFGIGGTNAHAVLEQPPAPSPSGPSRPWQVLSLSAKTESALDAMTARLAEHLRGDEATSLADVAHTLRAGRRAFEHRRAVLCQDRGDALEALEGARPERRWSRRARPGRHVVFLFPGQGAQYVGMGRELYAQEPIYRDVVDHCLERLASQHALDLRPLLLPEAGATAEATSEAEARLRQTGCTQPALFVVEYALARLLMSWGITPSATLGHSVGEYVSACLAGVLDLDDALALIAARGRLMEAMPAGVMLAVPLSEEDARARLQGRPDLWLSALNGPARCTLGGTAQAVDALATELEGEGLRVTRLHTSHAFHSGLMEAAVAPFQEAVAATTRRAPDGVPYVSSLSGDWVGADDVSDPTFWGRQIREPVRWSDGVVRVLEDADAVLLEVGPGRTLGTLSRLSPACGADRVVLPTLPEAGAADDDQAFLLGTLARLWTAGAPLDADGFRGDEQRRRVPLPTYPFQRERYWIERRDPAAAPSARRPLGEWFHVPVWRPTRAATPADSVPASVLVFGEVGGAGEPLAEALRAAGASVRRVRAGAGFEVTDDGFRVAPDDQDAHERLWQELSSSGDAPDLVVHAWLAADDKGDDGDDDEGDPADDLARGFLSLSHLGRALGRREHASPVALVIVTRGVHVVSGVESIRPERAAVLGMVRSAGLEQPDLGVRLVDLAEGDHTQATADALLAEVRAESREPVVALREGRRWTESFVPVPLPEAPDGTGTRGATIAPATLRPGSTWLLTGGLGGMGLAIARDLWSSCQARLVLTGRTGLPPTDQWEAHLAEHPDDATSRRIRAVQELERDGAEVLVVPADVTDAGALAAVVSATRERFGSLDGVVHAAGVPPGGLLMTADAARTRAVLAPKVEGTRALLEAVAPLAPEVVLLCSSLNAVKGFPGAADYGAANAVLDAFARAAPEQAGPRVVSIAWNRWRESGMAVDAAGGPLANHQGISDAEGGEVLRRIVAHDPGAHVLVSERPLLDVLLEGQPGSDSTDPTSQGAQHDSDGDPAADGSSANQHPRPELGTEFVSPASDDERAVAAVWEELFGIQGLGVHDDFFELGGHSLLATRLLARIGETCPGATLSLRQVFDHPTIAGQAALLPKGGGSDARPADASGAITPQAADPATLAPDIDALSDDEVADLLRKLTDGGPAAG